MVDLCRERNLDLKAVGADGARVNTGVHNGCIILLELEFSKPLHWFICQLHGNELHSDFTRKPIVVYYPICGKNSVHQIRCSQNLSTDQKYLYNIYDAVQSGIC